VRIYDGTPRQDYEEVLRSIGAFLDQRSMRDVLLTEAPDGFILQGLAGPLADQATWSDATPVQKETYTFLDEDISRFMEEAAARRGRGAPRADVDEAGPYERAFRVLGRYFDQQKPRDVFFFEQDGAYVIRLLMSTRTGSRHVLAEFTADELRAMVAEGSHWRGTGGRPPG
jgi:hypothetical protein